MPTINCPDRECPLSPTDAVEMCSRDACPFSPPSRTYGQRHARADVAVALKALRIDPMTPNEGFGGDGAEGRLLLALRRVREAR